MVSLGHAAAALVDAVLAATVERVDELQARYRKTSVELGCQALLRALARAGGALHER